MKLLSPSHRDNLVRWSPTDESGHYESHFIKVNLVEEDVAFWWKFTVLQPLTGPASFEVWAIFFDVLDPSQNCAGKKTFTGSDTHIARDELHCVYGNNVLRHNQSNGEIRGDNLFSWDISWEPPEEGFRHFPYDDMYDGGFPKAKALSPAIDSRFSGTVRVNDREFTLDGTPGMQGHNWGRQHADTWVWVHCNQFDGDSKLTFEAVSSIIKIGPLRSPTFTILHVQDENGEKLTLNGWLQMIAATSELNGLQWRFRADNGERGLEGIVTAEPNRFVGINYYDPDGQVTHCLNSKVATAQLNLLYKRGGIWRLDRTLTATSTAAFEIGIKDDSRGVEIHLP